MSTQSLYLCSDIAAEQFQILARLWRERGHRVVVVAVFSVEYYRKLHGGNRIQRLCLRLLTKLWAPCYLVLRAWFAPGRSDFIVTTSPFYSAWLISLFAAWKRHNVVHLLYDLYPDAIETLKPSLRGSLVCRIAATITRQSQRHCSGVVYLGAFLRAHTESRYGIPHVGNVIDVAADNSLFQNHWPEERIVDDLDVLPGKREKSKMALEIRYGGQLGHMHCADVLAACVRTAVDSANADPEEFSFFVSGAGVATLKPIVESVGVQVKSPSFELNWREGLKKYDLALTSLTPGGATVCFPSKTYAMLSAGLAILAVCPLWSDMGQLILKHQAGWVVNNSAWDAIVAQNNQCFGDGSNSLRMDSVDYLENLHQMRSVDEITKDFVNVLAEIRSNPDELLRRRRNAWKLAHDGFSEEWQVKSWKSTFANDA